MAAQRRFRLSLAVVALVACALVGHGWYSQRYGDSLRGWTKVEQQDRQGPTLAEVAPSSKASADRADAALASKPSGAAASQSNISGDSIVTSSITNGTRIPCLIHQSWKTHQLPSARAARWQSTWHQCLPDCRYRLWSDADNRQLVSGHYSWLLPMYDGLSQGVQKADLVRYLYMLHYGGIYADIDTVCVRDFRHLLRNVSLAFGGMEGRWIRSVSGTYVQNSFMVSEPGHPFWLGLVLRIFRQFRRHPRGGAEETTGPLVLMAEMQQYLDSGETDLKIFPHQYFNPFSWITNRNQRCKTHGSMSQDDEVACVASFPSAFVVQMHSKSWGGGKA